MEFYINKNHWKKFWKKHGRVEEASFAADLQTFLNEVNQNPKKFDQIREKYPNVIKKEPGVSVFSLKPLGTDSKLRLPCGLNRKGDLIAEQFCEDHDQTYNSALTRLKSKGPRSSEGMISLTSTLKSLSQVGEETPDRNTNNNENDLQAPENEEIRNNVSKVKRDDKTVASPFKKPKNEDWSKKTPDEVFNLLKERGYKDKKAAAIVIEFFGEEKTGKDFRKRHHISMAALTISGATAKATETGSQRSQNSTLRTTVETSTTLESSLSTSQKFTQQQIRTPQTEAIASTAKQGTQQTIAITEQPSSSMKGMALRPINNAAIDPVLATSLIAPLVYRNVRKFGIEVAKNTTDNSLRDFLPQNTVNKITHKPIQQMPWYKNWAGPITTSAFILADSHPIETYQELGSAATRDKIVEATGQTVLSLGVFHATKAVGVEVLKKLPGMASEFATAASTAGSSVVGATATPIILGTKYALHEIENTDKSIDKASAYGQNLALECKDPFIERVQKGMTTVTISDDSLNPFNGGLSAHNRLAVKNLKPIDAIMKLPPIFKKYQNEEEKEKVFLNHLKTDTLSFKQRMGCTPSQFIDEQKKKYISSLTPTQIENLERELNDYYNRHPQIKNKASIDDLMTFKACLTVPDEFREDYIANNRDNSALTKKQLLSALGRDVFCLNSGSRCSFSPEEFLYWSGQTIDKYTQNNGGNLSSAYSKMTDPGFIGGQTKRTQKEEVITTLHELAVKREIPLITEKDFEQAMGMSVENYIDQQSKKIKETNPNIKEENLHAYAIADIIHSPLENVIFNDADKARQEKLEKEREGIITAQKKKEDDLLLSYSGLSREEFSKRSGYEPYDVLNMSIIEAIEDAAKTNHQVAESIATDEGKALLFASVKQEILQNIQSNTNHFEEARGTKQKDSITSTLRSLSQAGEETPDAGKTQQQSDQKKPPINPPQPPLPPRGRD